MKKYLVMLMLLVCLPITFAQTNSVDAGVTPDSPLYGMEKAIDNIRLGLTFNAESKEMLRLRIAEERLAEYQAMVQAGNLEAGSKALEDHNKRMNNLNLANLSEEAKVRVQERLRLHQENLEQVRNNVPENAKGGLSEALTQSKGGQNGNS